MTDLDMEIKSLLYDNSFKHIFLEEPKILANILCSLLGLDFNYNYKVEVLNSELIKQNLDDDKSICDIILKVNDTVYINCEVNKEGYTDYKRYRNEKYLYAIFYYICNHCVNYTDMKDYHLYQVNINGRSNIKNAISFYVKENTLTQEALLKNFSTLNLDVAKCEKKVYNYTSDDGSYSIDKRIFIGAMFACTNLNEIRELLKKGGIKKVNIDRLLKIMKDKNNDEAYLACISAEEEREKELATTRSEGIEIGEKRGEKQKEVEITKNLLKEGLPEKMISKVTSLSLSEINAIKLNLI